MPNLQNLSLYSCKHSIEIFVPPSMPLFGNLITGESEIHSHNISQGGGEEGSQHQHEVFSALPVSVTPLFDCRDLIPPFLRNHVVNPVSSRPAEAGMFTPANQDEKVHGVVIILGQKVQRPGKGVCL